MKNRTSEIKEISKRNDAQLRIDKMNIVSDLLAKELGGFNDKMSKEVQSFSEHFLSVGPTYSKINSYLAETQNSDAVNYMIESVQKYRASIDLSLANSASLLKTIMSWPPSTTQLNKSKRDIELTIKELTKQMLIGLKLLDEAMRNS
jgi:hypothetical protein